MSWNIFKRVAELEKWVRDLNDFHFGNSRRIKAVEDELSQLEKANKLLVNSNQALIGRHENIGKRLANLEHQVYMQSRQLNPYSAAPVHSEGESVFTKDEVDQEKERKRQYQREWYAKNKASKAAKAKKNAYARAYYARTKGAKNA